MGFLRSLVQLLLMAESLATPRSPTTPGIWSTMPNITLNGAQFPHQEHSVALVGDDMYVLGGIWEEVAPMPVALNHVNVAVVGGKIYYLGGLAVTETGGPAYWNASGACAMYDPATNEWEVLPDMPQGRAIGSAATLVVDDTIYLPGGLLNTNLTNDDEGTTAMFTAYNVATRMWSILPDLPAPRDHAGKGSYGQKLYVLGGRLHGHWNVVDTVFGYNIITGLWSTDFPRMPTGRGGCTSATIGSRFFISGGEGDPSTATNVWPQVQAFDARRHIWTNYTDMATPIHGSAAVAYQGSIVIPGGATNIGGAPTQLVQKFVP